MKRLQTKTSQSIIANTVLIITINPIVKPTKNDNEISFRLSQTSKVFPIFKKVSGPKIKAYQK